MSAHQNKQLARTLYGLFSEDRFDDAVALATEDIEIVLNPFGQTFQGRNGFRDFMMGFKGAFPNIIIDDITHQIATEDAVVTEFKAHGTHTGPMLTPAGEIPATGRTVEFVVCEVWGIRDGKVSSLHNYQDAASIMRQLGLVD